MIHVAWQQADAGATETPHTSKCIDNIRSVMILHCSCCVRSENATHTLRFAMPGAKACVRAIGANILSFRHLSQSVMSPEITAQQLLASAAGCGAVLDCSAATACVGNTESAEIHDVLVSLAMPHTRQIPSHKTDSKHFPTGKKLALWQTCCCSSQIVPGMGRFKHY